MTDISTLDHSQALKARLETTGYPVGFGQAPLGVSAPYFVLYPITSGPPDGDLADPDSLWELLYQITCVGVGMEQAQDLGDLARATLAASPLTVAGRSVWRVALLSTGEAVRDDTMQPPLWMQAETVGVQTAPVT